MSAFRNKGNKSGKDYEKKSERLHAWSHLLRSISKFLWLIVILIVLVALGKMFVFKSGKDSRVTEPVKKTVVKKVDWSQVDKEIEKVMVEARLETEKLAADRLDQWIDKNMARVDSDFLKWYFSYWTQQELGIKALLAQVWHWVDSDSPSAAERVTREVQEEFTNRVIRPQIAQLEMERIIDEIVSYYTAVLKGKLEKIPGEYQIKPADWDRYISDISVMVKNVEANRGTSIPLKALVGLTAGGAILVVKALRPVITKIGAKISSKLAAKSAAKMAAKTGGKVAAKTGGKFLGAIIAVGIIIWDVWDHHATVKKAKPVLRQNIYDYLKEVKRSILHDPEYGIMTVIYQMEQGISKQARGA
jgi:hypothetical protein